MFLSIKTNFKFKFWSGEPGVKVFGVGVGLVAVGYRRLSLIQGMSQMIVGPEIRSRLRSRMEWVAGWRDRRMYFSPNKAPCHGAVCVRPQRDMLYAVLNKEITT